MKELTQMINETLVKYKDSNAELVSIITYKKPNVAKIYAYIQYDSN